MSDELTPGRGLRCVVTWTVHQHQLESLIADNQRAGTPHSEAIGRQHARITLTAHARRLDLDGTTPFGTQASFIETGDQIVWLQHEARVCVRIGHRAVPGPRFERRLVPISEPNIEMDAVTDTGGRRLCTVSLTLADPVKGERYLHRLILDPGIEAGELGVRLLGSLLGDTEYHMTSGYPLAAIAEVVARVGCPVASTIEVVDADNRILSELGGFRVHDLVFESMSDEVFAIPADYRELRGVRDSLSEDDNPRPSATHLEPVWIDAGRRLSSIDGIHEEVALRIQNPVGDGGPGDDEEPEPEPDQPTTTTQAAYGMRIDQHLFDDIRMLVTQALGPLAGTNFAFDSTNGLMVDWLPKLLAGVLASCNATGEPATGLGTFILSLLHDVLPPAQERHSSLPSTHVKNNAENWGWIRGRGLLDRIAKKRAQSLVEDSALTSAMLGRLPANVVTALGVAGPNWDSLTVADQLQIMFAVLLEEYGAPRVSLPSEISYNWADLVVGEFQNYASSYTLPSAIAGAPGVCPLITALRCRSDGAIDGSLMLGSFHLTGTLNRRPGVTFAALMAAGPLASFLFHGLEWVLSLLPAIGVFIALDIALLVLSITDASADFTIRFERTPSNVFEPRVDVNVTGQIAAGLTSYFPTLIHEVVDLVVEVVANSGTLVLDKLREGLQRELTKLARDFLGSGFPASLLRLDVPVTGGRTSGRDDQHVYIEATIAAPPGLNIPMIAVPADTDARLTSDLKRLSGRTGARHYLSLVSSQNAINVIVAALWRAGAFNAQVIDAGALKALAKPPYPSGASVLRARISVVAPPQFSLAQAPPTGTNEHGLVELKAKLVLEPYVDDRYEWAATWRSQAQTVIGSALISSAPLVQITSGLVQPLDLLVNLSVATLQVDALKRVESIRHTVTEEIWDTDSRGKPKKTVITYEEIEERETPFALSAQEATQHAPLLLEAMRQALVVRDVRRAPRRDGVKANGTVSGTADPFTLQSYLFDSADPDDVVTPAAYVSGDLGFDSGLLFQHLLLAGMVLAVFDPTSALLTRDIAGLILDTLPQK